MSSIDRVSPQTFRQNKGNLYNDKCHSTDTTKYQGSLFLGLIFNLWLKIICHYLENKRSHYFHSGLQHTLFSYKIRVGRGLRRYTEDKKQKGTNTSTSISFQLPWRLRFRLIYKSSDTTMISVKINTLYLLKNQFRNTKASMQNSKYKKCKGWLPKQVFPSERGIWKCCTEPKELEAELADPFPQFIYEASGQTLTGKAYSARLRMYRHLIPGAICNYTYLKYTEINIQNTSNPLI